MVNVVRVIGRAPRHHTLRSAQLLVEMVESMAGLLRDPDTLLQQVSQVLDMLRLLLQEPALNHVLQSIVTVLVAQLAQADEVLQKSLLDLEGFVHGLDGVDWVVGPFDLGGGDVRGFGTAAALHEVALEPLSVGEALSRGPLPEPERLSGRWTSIMKEMKGGNEHGEAVQRYVGTGAVGTELAEEVPALPVERDVSSDALHTISTAADSSPSPVARLPLQARH